MNILVPDISIAEKCCARGRCTCSCSSRSVSAASGSSASSPVLVQNAVFLEEDGHVSVVTRRPPGE